MENVKMILFNKRCVLEHPFEFLCGISALLILLVSISNLFPSGVLQWRTQFFSLLKHHIEECCLLKQSQVRSYCVILKRPLQQSHTDCSCLNNDLVLKVCLHFSIEMAQYQIHSLHILLSPKAREIPALLSDSK